jgi:acetyl esterase/lipase
VEFNINPEYIGVLGFSRGSGVAALLAVTGDIEALEGPGAHRDQSSRIQAAFIQAGRFDYHHLLRDPMAKDQVKKYTHVLGDPKEQAEVWKRHSVTTYLSPDDPPMFLNVGSADAYRVMQMHHLRDQVNEAGIEYRYTEEAGGKHRVSMNPDTLNELYSFFDVKLKSAKE